jgi:hypothetical protein
MSTDSQRLTNAMIVSGLACGTAFIAWKYAGLDKKYALYGALSITGGSLAIAEIGTLADSLPYILGAGALLGLAILAF